MLKNDSEYNKIVTFFKKKGVNRQFSNGETFIQNLSVWKYSYSSILLSMLQYMSVIGDIYA